MKEMGARDRPTSAAHRDRQIPRDRPEIAGILTDALNHAPAESVAAVRTIIRLLLEAGVEPAFEKNQTPPEHRSFCVSAPPYGEGAEGRVSFSHSWAAFYPSGAQTLGARSAVAVVQARADSGRFHA